MSQLLVIIGATGMLGQALQECARERAIEHVAIARHAARYQLDASDAPALAAALDELQPSHIINAAALINLERCEKEPEYAQRCNAGIVENLVAYCGKSGARLIQISTDHYYSGDGRRQHSEREPVQLLNEYARSKFAGEEAAARLDASLILRTNIVGFRSWVDQPTFVEWAIDALTQQKPMTLFDDFFTSSIDVASFAAATFDLIEKNVEGLLNVAAREVASKAEFVLGLAAGLGLDSGHCKRGSVRELSGIRRAESLGLDVSQAEAILGYNLPGTQQVIDALVRRYKERNLAIR